MKELMKEILLEARAFDVGLSTAKNFCKEIKMGASGFRGNSHVLDAVVGYLENKCTQTGDDIFMQTGKEIKAAFYA